jgi:peptide/bleomycin uptake transporter
MYLRRLKMFKFFIDKEWRLWSILGSLFILISTWYQVQLDVKINEWFGAFYDTLQKALSKPGSVSLDEFVGYLWTFAGVAGLWIIIAIITGFFVSHWLFRWRTSMVNYYHDVWQKARLVEGAAQRVQEDTVKFGRIMESLGVGLLDSIMTLAAFLPILYVLSKKVTELPYLGQVDNALIWVAIVTAAGGTAFLAAVGIKLPGIEYRIQKEEAAYRKELVLGEDNLDRMQPATVNELFNNVRKINYISYAHYLYFNACKWSYFQGMVIVPYLALAPTIITGAVTLGFIQQITRAFGRVEGSLQYLVKSWTIIIELISVVKRLKEFEASINDSKETSS